MQMMRYILKIFICLNLFVVFYAQAQPQSQYKEGQNLTTTLYYTEDFSGAIRLYKQMINFDPYNPKFYYQLGFAYLNTYGKQDSALICFNKSLNLLKKSKSKIDFSENEVKFYLARAYRLTGNFDSAVIILEHLLKNVSDEDFINLINRELKLTEYSADSPFKVKSLGKIINSKYSEHSPVFCPDGDFLIFTSRRKSKFAYGQEENYDENIYISYFKDSIWTNPVFVSDLNTEANEATVSYCKQGNFFLIYKDVHKGDIYKTKFENGKWSEPEPLPPPINSKHRETNAIFTISTDTIYFTSDRPGGKGGMDIWMCVNTNGVWSQPINLSTINTKYNEEAPFITPDGNTLFFSSDRPGGFGNYDIYKSVKINETWTKPKNIGFPINSIDDDIFLTQVPNSQNAFYSSYRYSSEGFGDIYAIELDTFKNDFLSANIGNLIDSTNKINFDSIQVVLINTDKGQITKYSVNKKGKFIFYTEPNFNYFLKITYNNDIVFEDSFQTPEKPAKQYFYKNIVLKP